MKRYRLKKGKSFLQLNSGGGPLRDIKELRPGESALELKKMTRFDWLYGEEGNDPNCIILHIPYILLYVDFSIAVFRDEVEEILD